MHAHAQSVPLSTSLLPHSSVPRRSRTPNAAAVALSGSPAPAPAPAPAAVAPVQPAPRRVRSALVRQVRVEAGGEREDEFGMVAEAVAEGRAQLLVDRSNDLVLRGEHVGVAVRHRHGVHHRVRVLLRHALRRQREARGLILLRAGRVQVLACALTEVLGLPHAQLVLAVGRPLLLLPFLRCHVLAQGLSGLEQVGQTPVLLRRQLSPRPLLGDEAAQGLLLPLHLAGGDIVRAHGWRRRPWP